MAGWGAVVTAREPIDTDAPGDVVVTFIPEHGVYFDLPADIYHASSPLSNSQLNDLAASPWHYFMHHRAPGRPPKAEKPGQMEGTLAHCATFEPLQFWLRYAIGPTVNRNTKVWKAFVEDNPGRIAIQVDQYDNAMRQAAAVHALPDVRDLLRTGHSELSAFWTDEQTGVMCRCRPDWTAQINDTDVILIDGKTYSSADPREFERQVYRKGYHRQDAHYSEGYARASGMNVVGFVFVSMESDYPNAASACVIDEPGRAIGRAEVRRLVDLFAQCDRDNVWPGFGDTIHQISLPNWAK